MSDETEKKPEEEKKMDEKPEDKEKTSDDSKEESNKAIIDGFTKIADVLSKNTEVLSKIDERLTKALEEPTDLPLKPKVSAEDDIGDKVKVPDTYQSNSQQASIDDSDPKNDNEKDPGDLKMQEKTVEPVNKSTQLEKITAPRPSTVNQSPDNTGGSTLTSIEKSYSGTENSPILDDMRKVGIEGKAYVANRILKGEYYMPTDQEVGRY